MPDGYASTAINDRVSVQARRIEKGRQFETSVIIDGRNVGTLLLTAGDYDAFVDALATGRSTDV